MTMESPAAMRSRGARRIPNLLAAATIVAAFMSPTAARPAPPQQRLITIPPAKLPLRVAPDAVAAETPISVPALHELIPGELQVLPGPRSSGLALHGTLVGKTASATDLILALFADTETFDRAPAPQLQLADENDRRAQALFTARVHGAPVVGVASAALCDTGGGITVIYDDPEAFLTSFPYLRQPLAPSDTIEIGISDNSVSPVDTASASDADANWDQAIAAVARGGKTPIDATLARTLADRLASDTGEKWSIVSPAALR